MFLNELGKHISKESMNFMVQHLAMVLIHGFNDKTAKLGKENSSFGAPIF